MDKCLLSEVSASDPYLKALPALAWAPSILDRARYVAARIVPSEGELEGFRQLSTTRDYAVNERWFQQSQVARLARWFWNRPPRAGTLHVVRGGLESEQSSRAAAGDSRSGTRR